MRLGHVTHERTALSFSRARRVVLLAGIGTAITAVPAIAQVAPSNSPEQAVREVPRDAATIATSSQVTEVRDIVVTAQRRSERLVDVPMSVSVANSQDLSKAGVVGFHEISNLVSGVQINFAGCCTQPSVRGISTLTTGVGFENNVAVYVDGIYQPDQVAINSDLANISSVEVLKGPQGTLWGRNATGGAILINTLAPSKTLTGKISGTYARFNDRSLSGYISGPLADTIRLGVAAYGRRSDGYNRRLDAAGNDIGNATPERQTSIRAKLEADLTSALTATLGYNYGLSQDPRPLTFAQFANTPASIPPSPPRASQPYEVSGNRPLISKARTHEGTLRLALDVGVGTLSSYTSYAKRTVAFEFDFDGSYVDLNGSRQDFLQNTFQQSVDLNITSVDRLNLVIGAMYFNDQTSTDPVQRTYSGGVQTSAFYTKLRARSIAAYVDGTYNITEKLALNLGARYTSEKKLADFTQFNGSLVALYTIANDERFSAFTPRASIRYELAPRTNVYASYSRGFRSGGFQPGGAVSQAAYQPFDPEKITAYEVGFKTQQGTLNLSTAAFYYDYRDLQVGSVIPNPNGNGTLISQVINADKAEVYGIDGDLNFKALENWNVHVGGAYLHARYKRFPNAVGTGLNVATGLNVTNQPQNWSGQQMTRAPNFSFVLGSDYTIDSVANGKLNFGGNLHYTSSYITNSASLFGPLAGDLANRQRFRQEGYVLINLQANWTDAGEHFTVGIFGNNVTDKAYRITYSGSGFGSYASYAPPATYGARVGYNF